MRCLRHIGGDKSKLHKRSSIQHKVKPLIYETGPVNGPMTKIILYEAIQCKSKDLLGKLPCQGHKGHDGPHWCYGHDGWLSRWVDKGHNIPSWEHIAHSVTSPWHKSYVHPKNLQSYRQLSRREIRPPKPGKNQHRGNSK